MTGKWLLLAFTVLGTMAPLAALQAQDAPARAEESMPLDPRFSAERIEADVAFLADDLLEGRETGSRGYDIASLYAAQQFAASGLKPMGDNGTWFQSITFQKTVFGDGPAGLDVISAGGTTVLANGTDAVVRPSPVEPGLDLTAPLVFVGYGMTDKALGIDDYAGLDAKGKIVVKLHGIPPGLPSEAAAHLLSESERNAAAHGAIGVISLIVTDDAKKVYPWAKLAEAPRRPAFTWIDTDGRPYQKAPEIRATARVNEAAAEALLKGAPRPLAAVIKEANAGGRPKGFALKTRARIYVRSVAERTVSRNVVGVIPGSDPELSKQYVVLSGHLDHLGKREARPGEGADADLIFNGAMDNAAGSATLIEVARVLAADKAPPRRSIAFLISTGEEKGLLGAQYYAMHPSVPAGAIVGDVDLDMPLLTYPFTDVVAYGADHSTVGAQVSAALAPMQIRLAPDPQPEEGIFVRSDHYAFVTQGVPAVFLSTGMANGGTAAWDAFQKNNYHDESDEIDLPFNWRAGARFAEANYRITRAMADADTPPRWYKGDYFGDIFAPKAPKASVR